MTSRANTLNRYRAGVKVANLATQIGGALILSTAIVKAIAPVNPLAKIAIGIGSTIVSSYLASAMVDKQQQFFDRKEFAIVNTMADSSSKPIDYLAAVMA